MKLAKHGIGVPEEVIYYDEDDIVFDDDEVSGQIFKLETDPADEILASVVKVKLDEEVKRWITTENIDLSRLVEQLVNGFYQTQKVLEKA